ncbi:MAG: c-type cytochrome [Caldilineaceae bacterium]
MRPRNVQHRIIWITVWAAIFLLTLAGPSQAQTAGDALTDPVVLGAWLYQGNCVRCHGDYGSERFASGLAPKELKAKIGGTKSSACSIKWAAAKGGPLVNKQIDAIVAYIGAWEASGAAPELPPLPAYPTATPEPAPTQTVSATLSGGMPEPTPAAVALAGTTSAGAAPQDAELQAALAQDPVYAGAYLYTQYCYRCHLGYERARQGSGISMEVVENTITHGKAGTSMPAFALTNGGPLKRRDIAAVVAYITAWETAGAAPDVPSVVAAAIKRSTDAIVPPAAPVVVSQAAAAPVGSVGSTVRSSALILLKNAFVLTIYCICGLPVLIVLVVGLLFASQIGYRGQIDK